MKIAYNLFVVSLAMLGLSLTSCSGDDDTTNQTETTETQPEFKLSLDTIRVKVGAENMAAVDVKSGGGEYKAFTIDESVAKVVDEKGTLKIEGLKNGSTDLVVSDKYNRYRRVFVQVYTTDVMTVSTNSLDLITPLGYKGSASLTITAGNGGYTYVSDNKNVTAKFDEAIGLVKVSAVSGKDEYTANITIKDMFGLSCIVKVTVKSTLKPFTDDDIKNIMSITSNGVMFDNSVINEDFIDYTSSKTPEGKCRMGFNYYNVYTFYVDFNGDLTVGKKTGGVFSNNFMNLKTDKQACDVEIIQNDGKYVRGIYSWVDASGESLHRGYFVIAI